MKQTNEKKIFKTIIDIVLWVFLVFAVVMTIVAFTANASNKGYPKFGNKCFFTVETNSMEGPNGFYVGDLIVGRVLTDEEKNYLQIGDVITYYMDIDLYDGDDTKTLNTHRIIDIIDQGGVRRYRTQGDNNPTPDTEYVYVNDIEAIWTGRRISGLGSVLSFLRSSTGFLVCIILPLAVFFVYELISLILAINNEKQKKHPAISAEEEELIKQKAIEEYLAKQNANNSDENK